MKQIQIILEKRIDPLLVKELYDEFIKIRKAHYYSDVEKTILSGGRFCECAIAIVKYLHDGTILDLNKIKFETVNNQLFSLPKNSKEDELLFLLIPLTLKAIYSIRNKKRIAHMKGNIPDVLDGDFVFNSVKWVISQFLLFSEKLDPTNIEQLLNSVVSRDMPIIEEFGEGDIKILKTDLTFKEEMLLILYKYSKRLSNDKINELLRPKKKSYITTYLKTLDKERLVHINKEGAIITKLGVGMIESDIMDSS